MRWRVTLVLGVLAFVACATLLMAQGPAGPPKPGPEHKKLGYFVGKWNSEADMKLSPFGPGGKFTGTDSCEWFAGGFSVVCHSEGKMPMNTSVKGLYFLSYDAGGKKYVYAEIDSLGETAISYGTVEGDTWTWNGESKIQGTLTHMRFTLKQVSADAATYKFEMAAGDAPYALVMEGKQARSK